jgi:hypothetical protein
MGMLRRERDGHCSGLTARCIVGRSPAADVVIQDRFASAEHARLAWVSGAWELRDLGSKNGTFLNGQRIESGKPETLAAGARLGFGEPEGWVLEDASPPEGVVAEFPGELEPTPMAETVRALDHIGLRFVVSRDEEHVEISMLVGGTAEKLERKWFGYLLLTLARARRDDRALPLEERGWRTIDALSRMLKLDANAINVATHEIRRQLAAQGVEGAAGVIEVRRGQRRIGIDRVEIEEPRG